MLMQIREKATGIFAYIIVGLIAIPFAFWGIQEYFGGPGDQQVAEVNGEKITKRLFDSQLQNQRRYMQSILGDNFDSLYGDGDKLKQSVLDTLIENALVGEETESAGYRISNTKLSERIQAVPQFQEAGRFSPTRYEQLLSSQGRSPAEFEEQMRKEESINQYQGSAVYSSFLPEQDKKQYAALKQQKRNFDYILLDSDVSKVTTSEDEIQSYYEENKNSFKSLERVKLEYLEITQQAIGEGITFSDDELLESYNDDPNRYRSAELRKASHILFKLAEDATEEAVDAAFEKAKMAQERINAGESFSEVATSVSEDEFAAKNGGSLGFLARNDINNPVFMKKLFSMDKGDISSPLKTSLGVQLVQLEDITLPKTKSFEDVRSQIENELRAEAADKEFVLLAEQLSNLSYVNEDNLVAAAEELEMELKTTDWIVGAAAEGIASYPAVVTAAFSDDLINKGLNSSLLEVEDGHVLVVRVAEHEAAAIQDLEVVAEQVKLTVTQSKAREQMLALGDKVITELKASPGSVEGVAKTHDLSVQNLSNLLRDDDSAPGEIVDRAFSLSSDDGHYPVIEGIELDNGKYAVIMLHEINDVDESTAKIEQAEWISVEGRYGRREMTAMMESLRETGDVVLFPENL